MRAMLITADTTAEALAAALEGIAVHGLAVEPADHAPNGATLDDLRARAIVRAAGGGRITVAGVEIVRGTLRLAGIEAAVEAHDEGV